ncbi:hypothetical protein ACFPT7_00530 [Acidicapsa dinghuensis]|uniref:Uncharacterized protein n=1 Tax=Acidicapsa dinghuensis TaxID=2218256 RepID=A0ABW1EC21_9BACT|nr:hypothetical protein [Acidicapsa dinghuensis]
MISNRIMVKAFAAGFGSLLFSVAGIQSQAVAASAAAIPASTAIPVRFEHSIDTKHAKTGDAITAKTMQEIVLPGGQSIARGSLLTGHIVSSEAFRFDTTPYAHQQSSTLSIHFDKLETGGTAIPVNLSVRAIANALDSKDATYAHGIDETDHLGTITLIGGLSYSPLDKTILSEDGDAIAYNRKHGLFARLIPSGSCSGTETEQSVSIFSPDACGVYGFADDYMPQTGSDGSGTFTLATRGHSLKLYAGSTALLQVNETK